MDYPGSVAKTALPQPPLVEARLAAALPLDQPARELTVRELLALMEADPYFARLFGGGGC